MQEISIQCYVVTMECAAGLIDIALSQVYADEGMSMYVFGSDLRPN